MQPNDATCGSIPRMPQGRSGHRHKCFSAFKPIPKSNQETLMVIADRLKALREQKNMSQGDIEKRTGLLRCYISRVENGHIVPAIDTLERMAQALEVPMYALFYDGDKPPKQEFPTTGVAMGWGSSGRDARTLHRFRRLISRTTEGDLRLLLYMAQKMSRRNKSGRRRRP